jgi:hypothetical protein
VREHWRTAVLVADAIGVAVTTIIHLEGPAPIHLEASPFIIRVDVPHRLDRKVDPEKVVEALQQLDPGQLQDLAHRYATAPTEAP